MMREEKTKTTSREHFDVILPAGGRITGDFAKMAGTEVKALISLDGQTILKRTIEALQATKRVGRLVVIGPPAALRHAEWRGPLAPTARRAPCPALRRAGDGHPRVSPGTARGRPNRV